MNTNLKMWIKVTGMALCAAAMVASPAIDAGAQEKVIQKTTDDSGFEKQLTEVDLMHQTAAQLMTANQWEAAAAELEKVVTLEADRLSGWSDLAKCYKQLKQFDKAAAAYKAAHELEPENLDLMSNLGYAQLSAQQLEGAMETYNKMLAVDALSYDANVHLGFIYQKNGEAEKAAGFYEKALEGNTSDVQTMGSLAALYGDLGRDDDSIAMYERAIESADDQQKGQLMGKLGAAMITAKNFEKSAAVYTELVALQPERPAHRFNLAQSLMQIKRHSDAAPHLEKVIELKADYIPAYNQLATCYIEAGNPGKAIGVVQKALPLTEKKAGLYCTWGRALEKQQLYDEAMDMFQRAVNDPQYGGYAKKQIQRQEDLKKRAKMAREQG